MFLTYKINTKIYNVYPDLLISIAYNYFHIQYYGN